MVTSANNNSRTEKRIIVTLPARTADKQYITRDISASAIFIETDEKFEIGELVEFTMEFDSSSGLIALKCTGQVVRLENKDCNSGAAIRIDESIMESVDGLIYSEFNNVLAASCVK
jgi:hypothetical protein